MKPQDGGFIVVTLILLMLARKPKWFAAAGLICLVLSIPLFSAWIFFTAQRLIYYAATFFLAAIVIHLFKSSNK